MEQNERLTEREADVLRLLARTSRRAAGGPARIDLVTFFLKTRTE